jgi:PAS domain S-box-containing protein
MGIPMKSELDQRINRPLATRLLGVVFGFFLVVVICLTIVQMVVEYRYQENSIRKEFSNIQTSFEHVLAGEMWHLDENALRSTVEGMIELPVIVGMKIADESGKIIALGGVVNTGNDTGETGVHVHLQGTAAEDEHLHSSETHRFKMFEADFPIIYPVNQQPRVLGRATLYSNASVVFNRVKASFLMLGVKTVIEIALLWLIFKMVFVRLLKKPLAELTTAVERVTLDNLNAVKVSAPSGNRDELGVLAESFNKMLLDLQIEIEKRRIADESLAASEAKLSSILRVAPVGIGVTKGRMVTELNPAMCDITGYSREELLGQGTRLLYLTNEECLSSGDRLYAQIDQQDTGMTEAVWRRKDGQRVDILLSAAPLNPNDPDDQFTVVAVDITERKQAEKDLKLAHEKLLTILDSIDSTVYVADMDTYEILFMNKKMITDFGGNKTGDLCYSAFRKNSEPCECCTNGQLIDKDGNPAGVCVWHDKNPVTGRYYINHDRAIQWTDGCLGRIQIATDITELKRMEAQLQQAQKMESVGRLAGGVAHDFNNMLAVILGHVEMALEDLDPAAPLHASLQAVQYAAERSAALTRQLLAFARKQTVSPKLIDINDAVEGMLNMLRRLIGEDIDLLWQPGRNLKPVKVDPSQIDQLLANLCVNARDAIAGQGKITIETDTRTLDDAYCADHPGSLPGEYVLLEVSDDGCGMDKNLLNHIFEPFFTTKEQGKGTGLGLASVFGMVKQNNGFINVYSEPGQGTTFKIYLPAYAENATGEVAKVPDLPTEHGHETVLLVEDEPAILEMTTIMLSRLGYTVVAAASPGEAIRLTHEHRGRIDLLMTDVVMPEMNGRELAENLLSRFPDLKRLFMSGYTANVIAHHGVLDEGVHFIQKPFSMSDLGVKLRDALEG